VVGIEPVRLLDPALMLARVGRVSNRSGREVKVFPDISLLFSHELFTRSGDLQPEQSVERE